MPTVSNKRAPVTKTVVCTHCDEFCDVGKRAMSIFCPHCKKRLILEDFKINSYHGVREFATCGDVVVNKRGHVCAAVNVSNLTVKGKVQGDVVARECVTLHKTAVMTGDIQTPVLKVEPGAKLSGFLRIGVKQRKASRKNKTNGRRT